MELLVYVELFVYVWCDTVWLGIAGYTRSASDMERITPQKSDGRD